MIENDFRSSDRVKEVNALLVLQATTAAVEDRVRGYM